MGLDKVLVARPPATLSPGERTRAELAAATAAGARLLLLDEPTNHLDVEALQALESALASWPGALVVATHDARLRAGLQLDLVVDGRFRCGIQSAVITMSGEMRCAPL